MSLAEKTGYAAGLAAHAALGFSQAVHAAVGLAQASGMAFLTRQV